MTVDLNKGIKDIVYNHLNLPERIYIASSEQGEGNITYIYDATGVKLKKIVYNFSQETTNQTIYAGNYIYEDNGDLTTLKFFNQPEGYVEPTNNGTFKYVYQYKDHLGNIRLSYSDSDGSGDVTASEIIEEKNYYPFGLKHKGYNDVVSANVNSLASKFKYNGVELEESLGLNLYEMDLRSYDPAIARFNRPDPVVHFDYSPYQAFDNNPIFWADPSGADSASMEIQDLNGNWHTIYEGQDYTTIYDASDTDPDAREVVKQTRKTLKEVQKTSKKLKKAFNAIDGFYGLGDGVSSEDQTAALQNVYNSLKGLLPRSVSFGVFAKYYDTYLAMANYQLKVIEQGLKERSKLYGEYSSKSDTTSDLPILYPGGFPGGTEVYNYMQQVKSKRADGKDGGNIVNINNKILKFVYRYQSIIQFTTGQSLPTMYTAGETVFNTYIRLRSGENAIDYQTAEYFMSNFDALEGMLYGGLKVQTD